MNSGRRDDPGESGRNGEPGCACLAATYTYRMNQRASHRRATWKIERASSFAEAETQARIQWHGATSAERFQAAAQIRCIVYGKAAATARLQRVLELVPGP